jgi:hypothetical protein
MRIGLVLFGHLRSYRQTHDSFLQLKKLLQQEDNIVDVFCHTWDIEESVTAAWWKSHDSNSPPPAVDKKEIILKYNPALYYIEPSKEFDEPELGIKSLVPLAGMLSMLYSQLRSFELLKKYEQQTGQFYDVIIKSRYDVLYEIAPGFASLLGNTIKNNCIYLPSSNPYELAGSYSDIFALGTRQEMEKYFSFNDHLIEAASIYNEKGYREMVPELFMSVFLKNSNIPVREIFGFRIHILRMNGEKFPINSDKHFEGNSPLCFYKPSIEKCIGLLPSESNELANNSTKLAKKYIRWILNDGSEKEINEYASFYNGNWISLDKITQLVNINKHKKIFADHVLKDFFEISFWNAKYNFFKKILLATLLAVKGGYGLLYFNIIKKKKFG